MYQNKNYTHNMLHYRTTHKPITLYDQSDLNMCKMKMFVNTLAKTKDSFWNIWESHINLYNRKESVLCIEVTKIGEKLLQSVSWILAEFYFNRGLQRLYTGTCIILQKTINGFLCLLIVFLNSKTYQLILKDVIKLNRNLRQLIEIKLLLVIRTKWYWLKSIYLIKAVFNLSSQQTVINDNRSS